MVKEGGWFPDMEYEASLIVIVGVEVSEVCVGICFSSKLWVEVFVSFLQEQIVFVEGLDGFHCVVLVQFVDVVGDAGVERSGGYGVDDCCIVGLLLVSLAIRVNQQSDQAAQDGAAQTHCDHVEQVEISAASFLLARACNRDFWYEIGVGGAGPGLAAVARTLVSRGEEDVAVPHSSLSPVGLAGGPIGPVRPALWAWLRVAQGLFGVQAQADVSSVGRRRVVAGPGPHVVPSAAGHRALGPGRPTRPAAVHWTRRDVALLKLLRWSHARLPSVFRLRIRTSPFATPDPAAAIPAALGPRAPRRPAAVDRVS